MVFVHIVCVGKREGMVMERRRDVIISVAMVAVASAVLLILQRWQRSTSRRWKRTQTFLHKFAAQCSTPVSKLWKVADDLVVDMQAGLSSDSPGGTKLRMLVSNVQSLPTNCEEGIYYGLNLCATEYQISRAHLSGESAAIVKQESKTLSIPSNVSVASSSEEILDNVAMELAKFVSTEKESFNIEAKRQNKLGFTYSLPVEQVAVSSGTSINWKNLSHDDTVGKGIVDKINKAFERHGVDMHVSSMVDETVGNLIGDRCHNNNAVSGVTLSMGTNAAYVQSKSAPSISEEMIIDTGWGNFSSSNFPLTEFDVQLDAESSNPGEQIFEKLVSGIYLGEIVRRVLLKMAKETALFGDIIPSKLRTPYVLRSPDMASMHQDTSEEREVVGEKLKDVFMINDSTPMMREIVADVCDIVVERGARLAGAGILGILKKLGRVDTTQKSLVTVEGGLYQHYRLFRNYLHSGIWEMLGSDFSDNVVIQNSKGGSGIGAVFFAASQSHSTQNSLSRDT